MSKTFKDFIRIEKNVVDKDRAIQNFITTNLDRLQSMFVYENLPDTIPCECLEHYLMCNGYTFITKVNGELYALEGGLGGEQDAYYMPTEIVVNNPFLKYNATLNLETDGVLVKNDFLMQGVLPILNKYGSLLVESDLTIRCALINLRVYNTISASDDNTAKSAQEYINQIVNGQIGIIAESPFFEGVKIHNNANSTGYLSQLIQMAQYIKASFFNELGLNANYNLKREYISVTENSLADDILLPLAHQMLKQRKQAVEKINKMFGTDITVEFDSSWEANDSQNEKEIADNEADILNPDGESDEAVDSGSNTLVRDAYDEPDDSDDNDDSATDNSDDSSSESDEKVGDEQNRDSNGRFAENDEVDDSDDSDDEEKENEA